MAYAEVSRGTAVTGSGNTLSPTFGATTTKGNLLLCLVAAANSANTNAITMSGWTEAAQDHARLDSAGAIFYKVAAGSDANPNVSRTGTGTGQWVAQLIEFSGNDAAPFSHGLGGNGTSSPLTITMAGAETLDGVLVARAAGWSGSKAGTGTLAATYNNGATDTQTYEDGSASQFYHLSLGWGVTTGHAAAQNASQTNSNKNITGDAGAVATFLPPAAGGGGEDPFPYTGGGYYGFAALKRLWQGWRPTREGLLVPPGLWTPA